ncbi:hypothetical protein Tco_0109515 [Tanacetum coccineum]
MANVQGEQSTAQETTTVVQAPPISELADKDKAMVLHGSKLKNLVVDTSEKKDSDDEPPVKKLKFLIPTSSIPSPTLMNSILPEPIPRIEISKIELTPPRDESKGKGIAFEEPLKDLMPYIEEGGSVSKMPKLKSFITPNEQLTQEDIIAQVKEMKRLVDLKTEKEKAKMLKEFNECINQRADDLPITKISYRVSSSHEATMMITRGNDPLNVFVHNKFRLNTLGFSEWLEVHALASKTKGKIFTDNKKRKQTSELIKKVFLKDDIVVDGMHRNLIPPLGVEGRKGLVIREPESGVFFYNGNFDLVFQREEEFHLATTPHLVRLQNGILRGTPEAKEIFKELKLTIEARDDANQARKITSAGIEGLSECKASASNLRRIQVKDVEDHLKTYSSAGMDISWYVEGIRCGSKESQRWQYSDYPITL